MALELRQQLKLTQQLIMTPQLQMAIKLLQLSRLELMDTIQTELEENPALEEVPESTPAEQLSEQTGLGTAIILDIRDGKTPITLATAWVLGKAIGPSAQFWLKRQRQHDATLRDQARAEAVFDAIVEYKTANDGIAPSVRELLVLCALPGVSSTSQMVPILARLEAQGRIERAPKGATRNIRVPGAAWVFGHNADAIASFAMQWDALEVERGQPGEELE